MADPATSAVPPTSQDGVDQSTAILIGLLVGVVVVMCVVGALLAYIIFTSKRDVRKAQMELAKFRQKILYEKEQKRSVILGKHKSDFCGCTCNQNLSGVQRSTCSCCNRVVSSGFNSPAKSCGSGNQLENSQTNHGFSQYE